MFNSRVVLGILLAEFVTYWHYIYLHPNDCKHLLSDGYFLMNGNWQPTECILHYYINRTKTACLNSILSSLEHSNKSTVIVANPSDLNVIYEDFRASIEASNRNPEMYLMKVDSIRPLSELCAKYRLIFLVNVSFPVIFIGQCSEAGSSLTMNTQLFSLSAQDSMYQQLSARVPRNDSFLLQPSVGHWTTQIVWNWLCNAALKHPPGVCCAPREPFTAIHYLWFAACLCCALVLLLSHPLGWSGSTVWRISLDVCRWATVLSYFYLCDRTNVFGKESKSFIQWHMLASMTWLAVIGLCVTQPRTSNEHSSASFFMSREMTTEWKGWMQAALVLYHLAGASQEPVIYAHMRLLVAAYLFLTGYGTFMYCSLSPPVSWRHTLHRLGLIVLRWNVLVVLLCGVMRVPYQLYYFVPLVTFWFVITFLLLNCPPTLTQTSFTESPRVCVCVLAVKGLVYLAVVLALERNQSLFYTVFGLPGVRWLFATETGLEEWRFRWTLDRFSCLYGVLFAFFWRCISWRTFHGQPVSLELETEVTFRTRRSVCVIFGGLLTIMSYSIVILHCPTKTDYNQWHPHICIIPIVGYIAFRQGLAAFTPLVSRSFLWLGSISLEMYVAQYHVLLASDARVLLQLLPPQWCRNGLMQRIFAGAIYLLLCAQIRSLTRNTVKSFTS